ncbi:hypothetical protein WN51_06205 [Melipona quadrifasciata]|uniref:Uncharacterized protein n=1 Tax=Melipona quadrifasciata TaxID=166423 RepID=A0A0M8ZRV4_9HYME|nr:hypothetical protein WN51_06205 [Melipona quadrifasciata]
MFFVGKEIFRLGVCCGKNRTTSFSCDNNSNGGNGIYTPWFLVRTISFHGCKRVTVPADRNIGYWFDLQIHNRKTAATYISRPKIPERGCMYVSPIRAKVRSSLTQIHSLFVPSRVDKRKTVQAPQPSTESCSHATPEGEKKKTRNKSAFSAIFNPSLPMEARLRHNLFTSQRKETNG